MLFSSTELDLPPLAFSTLLGVHGAVHCHAYSSWLLCLAILLSAKRHVTHQERMWKGSLCSNIGFVFD